ncbi:hypothetical protein [Thalassolituus hydrocarboniclasticus]|uniref:GLUG domain-containing protein n=1 Tax=Thalassolituus hydrocarboniclasticus TaxID=2742796 RepID=A0ABY6A8B5_9GAMM|nr:hypothetical protein [Thalassolituus hydrocarboniclasticus]UXD86378.1 hypothetical protein HUF19_02490 [Thalassolituus hydrocarboniclasticus]
MNLKKTLLATAIIGLSAQVLAAEPRDDYDLDDNGLIEINSLQDLDAMRNYRDAESEFNLSTAAGCPEGGCTGFELTTDLNFDTNGDGVIDASDEFWNDGLGWDPVGSSPNPTFGVVFDGNNHVIRNLYINRPETDNVGLFGHVYWGKVYNLAVAGPQTSVTGKNNVGILIGLITKGEVTHVSTAGQVQGGVNVGGLIGRFAPESGVRNTASFCYSGASVTGNTYSGGLIGSIVDNNITECFATGGVSGAEVAGGLIGIAQNVSIRNTYASGDVSATTGFAAGLVGASRTTMNIYSSYAMGKVTAPEGAVTGGLVASSNGTSAYNSYWTEETGQESAYGDGSFTLDSNSGTYSQAILSCPTAADDTDCTPEATLYSGWTGSYTLADETVVNYWDFGTANQMPVLTAQGYVLRDRDGDGIWDFNDTYPDDPSNTAPKSSSGSSGGGSLIWLLGLAPLVLRRKSKA